MIDSERDERMPIIDAHAHLGDILYPGGGALISAGRFRKPGILKGT